VGNYFSREPNQHDEEFHVSPINMMRRTFHKLLFSQHDENK